MKIQAILEQDDTPKVGDLVHPLHRDAGTAKYGTIKKIEDGSVRVSLGGPVLGSYNISKLHSPERFHTDDPVWADLNGKRTIWKVAG